MKNHVPFPCLTFSFFSDRRVRHALDLKEEREGKWRRKFSSAVFTKGLIQEVVPPTSVQPVSTIDSAMNDSRNSWSSLELNDSVPLSPLPLPPPPPPLPHVVRPSVGQLKGRIQAGVQARVSDFWKEKVGRYVMQGDYISLIMEEKGCFLEKFCMGYSSGCFEVCLECRFEHLAYF